jgi:hypothetical protein
VSLLRQNFVLALLLFASTAGADGGPPEGASLAHLDATLSAARRARIATVPGVAVVSETRATPAGVEFRNLIAWQGSDTLRSPGLIVWERIRGIETEGGTRSWWVKRWPLALVGAGVGLTVFFAQGGAAATEHSPLSFFLVGAATGYGVGFVAEQRGSQWKSVYP